MEGIEQDVGPGKRRSNQEPHIFNIKYFVSDYPQKPASMDRIHALHRQTMESTFQVSLNAANDDDVKVKPEHDDGNSSDGVRTLSPSDVSERDAAAEKPRSEEDEKDAVNEESEGAYDLGLASSDEEDLKYEIVGVLGFGQGDDSDKSDSDENGQDPGLTSSDEEDAETEKEHGDDSEKSESNENGQDVGAKSEARKEYQEFYVKSPSYEELDEENEVVVTAENRYVKDDESNEKSREEKDIAIKAESSGGEEEKVPSYLPPEPQANVPVPSAESRDVAQVPVWRDGESRTDYAIVSSSCRPCVLTAAETVSSESVLREWRTTCRGDVNQNE